MPSIQPPASSVLLSPVRLGTHTLAHRVVVAPPVTDERSNPDIDAFYRERASEGGLIITPPKSVLGDSTTFGKNVAVAVHSKSGVVFLQLFHPHTGSAVGQASDIAAVYKNAALEAIDNGFDGVELNIAEGSMLEQLLRSEASNERAVNLVMGVFMPLVSSIGAERIGVRLSPYSAFMGVRAADPVLLYVTLLSRLHTAYPNLAFVHLVAGLGGLELPNAYSLDPFRAVMAFPFDIGKYNAGAVIDKHSTLRTAFISSNDYTPESALEVASRTGDLVAFGSPSLANPDISSRIRNGTTLQLDESTAKKFSDIDTILRTGKEYVFGWTPEEHQHVVQAMADVDEYLGQFDPALSYEGTDKQVVWRKSCWFACKGLGHPFLTTEKDIAPFDGEMKDGLSGLQALQVPELRAPLHYLRSMVDRSLITTARALGIEDDMILRCSVRYRVIKYVAHRGDPGGVGLHPDGNLLTALITNGAGLKVYDLDGTLREPGFDGTILMGGSTLYRWSNRTYLPTFHDVSTTEGQKKASIVGYLNFPDMTTIPRRPDGTLGTSAEFFHDIKNLKENDKSPKGELSPLWDIVIRKHKLVLPDQ